MLAGNVAVTVNPGGDILRIDGDSCNDELRLLGSVISSSFSRRVEGGPIESQGSGTFYFLGGPGQDRFYTVSTFLAVGGLEFEQGPDDDTFAVTQSTVVISGTTFPDGTTVRGGGRFFARGRAGDDILAISESVISTTGKFIVDGDSDDDAVVIAQESMVSTGNDILLEGNFGIDRVAISNSTIQSGNNNIDLLLGGDNDQVLLCSSAAITTTGAVTVNGEAGSDEFAIDGSSGVPVTATLLSVENPAASVAALDAAITSVLNARGAALAADPESDLFASIAASICE